MGLNINVHLYFFFLKKESVSEIFDLLNREVASYTGRSTFLTSQTRGSDPASFLVPRGGSMDFSKIGLPLFFFLKKIK